MPSIVIVTESEPRLPFSALFTPPHTRGRLIGLFLAVLELIKMRQVTVEQPERFGEIWVCLRDQEELNHKDHEEH